MFVGIYKININEINIEIQVAAVTLTIWSKQKKENKITKKIIDEKKCRDLFY